MSRWVQPGAFSRNKENAEVGYAPTVGNIELVHQWRLVKQLAKALVADIRHLWEIDSLP